MAAGVPIRSNAREIGLRGRGVLEREIGPGKSSARARYIAVLALRSHAPCSRCALSAVLALRPQAVGAGLGASATSVTPSEGWVQ